MYNQILFTNVLRLLEDLGMTKNQLAQKSGISISFISDLTNGKANPSLKVMEAIADALKTPLPTLLEHADFCEGGGGYAPRSLPKGFLRASAILTEFQAYNLRQWDQENRKHLQDKKPNKD